MTDYVEVRLWMDHSYGNRCPFCGSPLTIPMLGVSRKSDRTRAHIHSIGHPDRRDSDWVWACRKCNEDQGRLSLDEWWLVLAYRSDQRAKRVIEAIRLIGEKRKAARMEGFMEALNEAAKTFHRERA